MHLLTAHPNVATVHDVGAIEDQCDPIMLARIRLAMTRATLDRRHAATGLAEFPSEGDPAIRDALTAALHLGARKVPPRAL